ncbi:hypothetical protein M6B38_402030 [Iris pallida]|uniref:Uncharacterized protein n=1 Tax=Iris pallida TaxID=29817 RepID=A0AAX6FSJ7_IRIPA|nr:hypothetical protein M6B38_402030 [Iris pallida]
MHFSLLCLELLVGLYFSLFLTGYVTGMLEDNVPFLWARARSQDIVVPHDRLRILELWLDLS